MPRHTHTHTHTQTQTYTQAHTHTHTHEYTCLDENTDTNTLSPQIFGSLLNSSQVAERLGNRPSNMKVAGSIPGRAK